MTTIPAQAYLRPLMSSCLFALSLCAGACSHPRGTTSPASAQSEAMDRDGLLDGRDACPEVPGVEPGGCLHSDIDGDGFLAAQDTCPEVAGVEPDGCPIPDTDSDQILDPDDRCLTEPETFNGYQDEDGCPDHLPMQVAKFTGAIRGVQFGEGGASARWSPGTVSNLGQPNREAYAHTPDNPYVAVADDPLSTFSADVDTASYSNVRRMLNESRLPPPDAVRPEELINYFDYAYPSPTGGARFTVDTEVSSCPWNPEHYLVRIGIKGKEVAREATPPRNLVFLIDVSGSMSSPDKLPLLKRGLIRLVQTLRAEDRVAIVVYAGAAGVVLSPTSGAEKHKITAALERLEAGGSTAGGQGLELAYKLAAQSFRHNGINRVLLASDGDFNVGPSSVGETTRLIERKRKTGVFLTTLGFGSGNYNDHLMEQLADKGDGNYAYIDSYAEAEKVLVREAGATLVTIARDVKLQVEFNPAKIKGYRQVGYENRQLADQDFDDDQKDAGELGSGHTVTALYELIPVGASTKVKKMQSPHRYQHSAGKKKKFGDELMYIKVRSKSAKGGTSQLRTHAVKAAVRPLPQASADTRFAVAVAAFAMVLRGTPGSQSIKLDTVKNLAEGAIGSDIHGDRQGFLDLIDVTAKMKQQLEARHTVLKRGGPTRAVIANVAEQYPRWARSKAVRHASELPASAVPILERAASTLNQFPSITLEISGHTNNREGRSESERQAIALARALVVRAYLVEVYGIEQTRLVTRSAGSTEPIDTNQTATGRARNQRIAFRILTD